MIAMGLSCNPQILIADEPTTALDVTIQAQITDLVKRLRDEIGMAIIWITHDLGVVAGLADRVIVMYAGFIVEEAAGQGPVRPIPRHPYTLGLLGSLPRLDAARAHRLISIEGLPPDLIDLPKGCPFLCPLQVTGSNAARPRIRSWSRWRRATGSLVGSTSSTGKGRSAMSSNGKSTPSTVPSARRLLEVKSLKMWFPIYRGILQRHVADVKAVDGINFDVYKGETLGLVGESGCGKSTTGRAILQLYRPTGGEVAVRGQEPGRVKGDDLRRCAARCR